MLDKLLFRYIGNAKKYIIVSVLLMMLKVVGSFFIAFALGQIIQSLFLQTSVNYIIAFLIFLLGFALRSGSLYLVTRYQTKITGEVKTTLRTEMISKTMRIGPSYLHYTSTANMINMGSDTIEQLENYYGRFLPQFFGNFTFRHDDDIADFRPAVRILRFISINRHKTNSFKKLSLFSFQ